MTAMIKINRVSKWWPDYYAATILDIDLAALKSAGITCLVFDLDNTLVYRRSSQIHNDYHDFLLSVRRAGFTILIATNTRRPISAITEQLDVSSVSARGVSMKPFASFYRRVLQTAEEPTQHIAMVGDRIINDIFGANRAGMTTILVDSGSRHRLLTKAFIRLIEK